MTEKEKKEQRIQFGSNSHEVDELAHKVLTGGESRNFFSS